MRTLMHLVLTIIAVAGSRQSDDGEILLREIIDNVNLQLKSSKVNLSQYVKDVFSDGGCSAKQLCQAAKIMMNTNLKLSPLHRRLSNYASHSGHHHCSVQASRQHKMREFLTKIKDCSQEQHSKLIHKKRHVK